MFGLFVETEGKELTIRSLVNMVLFFQRLAVHVCVELPFTTPEQIMT